MFSAVKYLSTRVFDIHSNRKTAGALMDLTNVFLLDAASNGFVCVFLISASCMRRSSGSMAALGHASIEMWPPSKGHLKVQACK